MRDLRASFSPTGMFIAAIKSRETLSCPLDLGSSKFRVSACTRRHSRYRTTRERPVGERNSDTLYTAVEYVTPFLGPAPRGDATLETEEKNRGTVPEPRRSRKRTRCDLASDLIKLSCVASRGASISLNPHRAPALKAKRIPHCIARSIRPPAVAPTCAPPPPSLAARGGTRRGLPPGRR
jgi:hypothetical protein